MFVLGSCWITRQGRFPRSGSVRDGLRETEGRGKSGEGEQEETGIITGVYGTGLLCRVLWLESLFREEKVPLLLSPGSSGSPGVMTGGGELGLT